MAEKKSFLIEATPRDIKGKTVRTLRSKGQVPAVLYGHNVAAQSLAVPASTFNKIFKEAGESTIVKLKVNGSEPVNVLIQDVQRHGTEDTIAHVDFYQVNMSEKLKANVPLVFVGESQAVKALGGTLVHVFSEVEVESLPGDLPHEIQVDISGLSTFEDAIRIKDLNIDHDKVKILVENPELVVASVQAPRSEEELKELSEAPVVADVSQVEGVAEPEPVAEQPEEGKTKEDSAPTK